MAAYVAEAFEHGAGAAEMPVAGVAILAAVPAEQAHATQRQRLAEPVIQAMGHCRCKVPVQEGIVRTRTIPGNGSHEPLCLKWPQPSTHAFPWLRCEYRESNDWNRTLPHTPHPQYLASLPNTTEARW